MKNQNFKAIGRIPGECIFVHQDNVQMLEELRNWDIVKCIGLDFQTRMISDPVIINALLQFVPHDTISSEGEREVISDLVRETFSEEQIARLNQQFEEIKYQE